MITNYTTATRICNRTCSSTISCNTCEENPNAIIATSVEYIDYPTIPEKPDPKKLTNFEKQKRKESWKMIQDKHSKRR